jgi:hypothetical protein
VNEITKTFDFRKMADEPAARAKAYRHAIPAPRRVAYRILQAPFKDSALGFAPSAVYECVWEGESEVDRLGEPEALLDAIWMQFQRIGGDTLPPEGYRGRSLSIGDVIELNGMRWYTPEPGRWKQITRPRVGGGTLPPEDYRRSLSISDVTELNGTRWYTPEPGRWKQITHPRQARS